MIINQVETVVAMEDDIEGGYSSILVSGQERTLAVVETEAPEIPACRFGDKEHCNRAQSKYLKG